MPNVFERKEPILTPDQGVRILARSAVSGFGASAGRDAYRIAKRELPSALIFAIGLFGTRYAIYDICRRDPAAPPDTWRSVLNGLIITFSCLISLTVLYAIFENKLWAVLAFFALQGGSAYLGLRAADWYREAHSVEWEVEQANLSFLDQHGFRSVGGRDDTVFDGAGNELKPYDERDDALVFKGVGRRMARAFIRLDRAGRMIAYEPPPSSAAATGHNLTTGDSDSNFRSPWAQPVPRSESLARTQESADASGERHTYFSHPMSVRECKLLLEDLDERTQLLLRELVGDYDREFEFASISWEEAQRITNTRDWAHFARAILSRLHRQLREVVDDDEAILIVDSEKLDLEVEVERTLLIDGPAIVSLRTCFRL